MHLTTQLRPLTFDDVVGQDNAKATLKGRLVSPRGTYLIHGPMGCGKTTLARIFARMVNCLNPESCSVGSPCTSCTIFYEARREGQGVNKHPDVQEMNAAEARGIDDVRRLIDNAKMMPRFKYRVIILDEVHQLTNAAQNALLKPFEEPGSRLIWCLCTTNREQLLGTIVSRSIPISITRLADTEVEAVLDSVAHTIGFALDAPTRNALVQVADGHARDALSALDSVVAAYAAGGQATVSERIAAIQSAAPAVLAHKYVHNLLVGNADATFSTVACLQDGQHIRFAEIVLEYLQCCMYASMRAQTMVTRHPAYSRLNSKGTLDAVASLQAANLLFPSWMKVHLDALAVLKTYSVPASMTLTHVASHCLARIA